MCDELESLTNSNLYPMMIIKDETRNLNNIYYTTFDYNLLGNQQRINNSVILNPVYSPEEMAIKAKYN